MDWLFVGLIPPLLFATSVIIDKYLLNTHFKGASSSLVIFTSITSTLLLPIIYFIHPDVLSIQPLFAISLIIVGFFYMLYMFPYLAALNIEESSRVVPLFQTIPVFGGILAFFTLGETLTTIQILASALIIGGSIGISLEFGKNKIKLNTKVILLMFLAAIIIAISGIVFKFVATETNFWTSLFWEQLGLVLIGAILITAKPNYRNQLISIFKKNPFKITALNFGNELINTLALIIFNFASLLAPIGLVWVLNGFQPLFVLIYGIIFTLFFPWIGKEVITKKALAHKAVFICITIIGGILLGSAGI